MNSTRTISDSGKDRQRHDRRLYEYDSIRDMNIFELQEKFVKTIIRDTIETYSGQWRLVHEAIQNAHDHIQLNDNIREGQIEIHLFVGSNTVSIKDNGTGIAIEKFNNIFLIGGSDKTEAEFRKILKGSQGVGIKSTLFTSKFFRVETVHKNYTWKYELKECYKFQEPKFRIELDAPSTKPSSSLSGSTFTYSLKDYTVQDFINDMVREYCEATKVDPTTHIIENTDELKIVLETYFRTNTYLGCTQTMLGLNAALKPIEVKVILDFDSRDPKDYESINLEYCRFFSNEDLFNKRILHSFPAKYLDVLEIHANIRRHERADKIYHDFREVLNNPPDQTTKKLLVQKFDKTTVKSLLSRPKKNNQTGQIQFEEDRTRLRKHKSALDTINGMYLIIGQKSYLLKYFHVGTRQSISVNGLPTNISLSLPIGALAYLNNIHLVLDVDCTLGFGKRNLPSRTKGSLDAFYQEAWNMLRRVVPLVIGQRADVDPSDIPTWDKSEELDNYRDSSNPFRQLNLFFRNKPKEEQEVIALFFELIGRKLLKGYFPFRVGGKTIYDGLFYIDRNQGETIAQNIKSKDLKFVEFKYSISRLLRDLDDQIKFLDDIDLLICWENDIQDDAVSEYSIHSLLREGIDPYPGAELRIKHGTKYCQVLVLKDYLESLNLS